MAPVDIDAVLKDVSLQIERLKILYEQYFIGVEKLPPFVIRREAERRLNQLSTQAIGNTGMRFKYAGLLRRWKTYAERWDKVTREIENGTYTNHRIKARKAALAELTGRKGDRADGEAAAEAGGQPASRGGTRPKAEIPGMSEPDLRALHQQYLTALRSVGDGRDIRYEGMLASLQKQVPDILKKNSCDTVTFSVAVKNGKVVLRATPRRQPGDPPGSS